MAVSLDSGVLDQFNTTEAKVLHDITDSLSIRGVGRIVNLPQIIVVGGQSTGKSSVLEAISHVRFPIAGGLCTRFATELVLRQASENRVNVSIKFASKAKAQHVFQRTGFSEESLPDIIQEAREQMGLSQNGRDFSKDVLRLEIEGPGMYPLTLVDLPGLFQVNTDDQSLQGKDTVDQLVGSYLRQENSIILVVIDATTQLANHGSLLMVKKHDPGRERTLGVITKPDCTRPGDSQERTYIQVAKNEERTHKLTLGWHVLRNRAEDETSLDTRDAKEEEFFRTTAWSSIPERNLGAASLRKKLSAVLYQHIRNRLPGVIADIELNLRERQEELDRLGIARSTPAEMRSFLLGIASEFQRLARDGIDGRYNDSFFGDLDSRNRKMRSQIRNLNRVFAWTLETKGASQTISGVSRGTGDDVKDVSLPAHLEAYLVNSPYDFPSPEAVTLKEITPRLQWQAAANQGRELPGVPNKELARQLFQKQAAPWKGIAEFHVGRVTQVAKFFADEIFVHIIGSPEFNRTTDAILSNCVDSFFAEKEALIQLKVKELLHPYSQGYAMPLDDDFYRALSGKSVEHVADRALKNLTATHPGLFEDEAETKLNRSILIEAMSSGESVAAGEFETEKVIDMMQTYYEVSPFGGYKQSQMDVLTGLDVSADLYR